MRRTLTVAACIAASAVPGLTSTGSAQAAETCFGLTPTVVATPGAEEVEGTEGDDVIVAEDVYRVSALGGNDAVCAAGVTWIDAGDGNDRVRSDPATGRNWVVLGSGSDLFEGSERRDRVWAERFDGEDPFPGTGSENTDVVRTYGGGDRVTGGSYGQADQDEYALGAGDDDVTLYAPIDGDTHVLGGPGADGIALWVLGDDADLSFDLEAGTATADGAAFAALGSIEDLAVNATTSTPVTVRGTGGPNRIYVGGRADIAAGAGTDRLQIHGDPRSVLGGPGRDQVEVLGYGDFEDKPVVYDLAHDLFTRGDVTAPFATEVLHVGTTGAIREDVRVLGTPGRDVVVTDACGSVVRGGRGDDDLRVTSEQCEGVPTTLRGDGGDDVLGGGSERDVLIGGTGFDRVYGGTGIDRCRAEVRRACES
ncbi:hypothetical protein [Nocardioides sp. SR21]|uniref:hypothetical protein n=1 Tax=Nocardioides sp. SR21 TaxID=2919501 RepID=UPI001FA98C96|nr:hypothetical protein [Nocardioides sp. SR21]